jgi:hypothetical protein
MVERHIVLLVCACIAVVGTLALAAWLERETPRTVAIGDLDDVPVGTLVTLEGTVEGMPVSGPKVSVVRLADATGDSISLFLGFSPDDLSTGTRVRATGRVAVYQGRLEVMVEDEGDLLVLSRPRSPEMDLGGIVGEPWGFDGLEPLVEVVVLTAPIPDLNGEDWWCLVGEPSSGEGGGVLALIGPNVDAGVMEVGKEVDLRVAVRYDASSGFVFLEVLGLA